jgi:chitin disaccharide deacetylase
MVGAPATADAVERARRLARLCVGLHVNLVEGRPISPLEAVPDLVDAAGNFHGNMLTAGLRFFFSPTVQRQLETEIHAQFAAFRATGLALDHVNAHRHSHIHPTVAAQIIGVGRAFGMRAMRLPAEPYTVLRRAAAAEGASVMPSLYAPWIAALRRRLEREGLAYNDRIFGVAWSGGMTEARLLQLIGVLPAGTSEIYCHPAVAQTPALAATMPRYRPVEELAALLSPAVRRLIEHEDIDLASYGELVQAVP